MPTQEKNNASETPASNNLNKSVKTKPKGKKPVLDNAKDGGSIVESKALDDDASPIPTGNKVSPTDWFTSEIQDMMYGFGDSSSPLFESAQLVEEIVSQQMTSLLYQAADVSTMRNCKVISPEDIIFLLRKDKVKLRRLVKYLEVKDLKGGILKANGIDEEDLESFDNKLSMSKTKRFKMCQDFVASFDTTGELLSLFEEEVFDDIKFERDQRLEQRTRCMDQQQYFEFCKARQASFAKKFRSTKFRDWLLKDAPADLKTTASAVEIFNYMAYETVAQIVDLALLIKKEGKGEGGDPISKVSTGISYNPEFPSVHLTNYIPNKPAGPHRPDSPGQTPISPPLSPNSGSVSQVMNPGAGCSKMKAKKRRKSETRNSCDNVSGCIEPAIIREVIQRYYTQSGVFSLFSKSQHSILTTRLMCC